MDMSASDECCSLITKYNKSNKVLAMQWNDSKVVSFILKLGIDAICPVQQIVRLELHEFITHMAIKEYQKFMGGVDRKNQI